MTHLINPGVVNTVSARLRFIDDYIKSCVKDGLEQLVILGADYDCRAYRMEELKNGITVFAEQCREKYFTGNNRKQSVSPLFSFAHAIVKEN